MKAISNIQYINDDLLQADPLWQRTVYSYGADLPVYKVCAGEE